VCFDFLYNFCLKHFSFKEPVETQIKNVYCSARRVPVIPVRLQRNLDFLDRHSKNIQISVFMKIRPVGTEFFLADGRADTTKRTVGFRNVAYTPKN